MIKRQLKLYAMLLLLIIAVAASFLIVPMVKVLASDITLADWFGTITIKNTGTFTENITSNITNIDSTNLIAGGYVNAEVTNCAMRNASGADVPFQPGFGSAVWMTWVENIGADGFQTQLLYFAESTGGEIAYFPASGGMVIADNASMEPAANFSIITNSFLDTDLSGNAWYKTDAIAMNVDDGTLTSGIPVTAAAVPPDIAPGVFGSWQNVDVSAYVPAGATGVVLEITGGNLIVAVRKSGSTDNRLRDSEHHWAMCGLADNSTLDIYVEGAASEVYLVGYTTGDFHFNTNATDYSFVGGFAAWNDIDISAEAPNAVAAIWEYENVGAGARDVGFRKKGSADNRNNIRITNTDHSYAIIGCDGAAVCQGWAQDTSIDWFLVGWVEGTDTVMLTNGVDKSIAAGGYIDVDCTAETAADAEWLFFEVINTNAHNYAMRLKGAVHDFYEAGTEHDWAMVRCDSGQVVEGKIGAVAIDWWVMGYSAGGDIVPIWDVVVTASGIPPGEYELELMADSVNMTLLLDGVIQAENPLGGASVPLNANDWIIGSPSITPYIFSYNHTVGGNLVSDVAWEYGTVFVDQSGSGNPAIPNFATISGDLDVTGNMSLFSAVAESEAPPYVLGEGPAFFTAPNITAGFTTVPPGATFPLANVIGAVAAATGTPAQLPLMIIGIFAILAASLTTSYSFRKFGSGSLIPKIFVIVAMLAVFSTLGFGFDFWMLICFLILAVGLAIMSKHSWAV